MRLHGKLSKPARPSNVQRRIKMKHLSKVSKSMPVLAGLNGVELKPCDVIKDTLGKDCIDVS